MFWFTGSPIAYLNDQNLNFDFDADLNIIKEKNNATDEKMHGSHKYAE